MTSILKRVLQIQACTYRRRITAGQPGAGAGKGGGGGGTIRQSGGAFGIMEAAREGQYFYKKQQEQLINLKKHLNEEITFHKDQIKRHEEAIERYKQHVSNLEKQQETE